MKPIQSLKRLLVTPLHNRQAKQGKQYLTLRFPTLEQTHEVMGHHIASFREAYDQYLKGVSTPDMAASFESACFLYEMANACKPKNILDYGSGFSSFIFRSYQKEHPSTTVYSVDDHSDWLKKTQDFLDKRGLSIQKLMTLEEFEDTSPPPFDLIFHDLGSMQTRKDQLPKILGLLSKNGVAILDDMHKKSYRKHARQIVKHHNRECFSARSFTLDKFHRFAEIAA